MELLKPVDQTKLDPSYAKVFRANENIFPTDTGNNATFDGAGALIGQVSLSITPSEILTKDKVFKYSSNGLNGQNDYFGFTYTLTKSFKNATRTFSFKIQTVNAIDSDVSANVKIIGGTRDGYVYKKLLSAASNGSIYSQAFDVPSDATSLVVGFQNHSTNTNIQIFVDDVALGYKAFDWINNVQKETWLIESAQNAMTTLSDYQFPVSPTVIKNGSSSSQTEFALNSNIIYHDRSNAGQSRFYATKDCRVKIRLGSPNMGINSGVYIGHSGRTYYGATSTSINGYFSEANAVLFMKAGEYFFTGTATGTTNNTADILRLSIESTIVSDNIIQTYQDNVGIQKHKLSLTTGSSTLAKASTNTTCLYYSTPTEEVVNGSSLYSVSNSPTLGLTFTMLEDCDFNINIFDAPSTSGIIHITKNASGVELTSGMPLPNPKSLSAFYYTSASTGFCSFSGPLSKGDIIRIQVSTTYATNAGYQIVNTSATKVKYPVVVSLPVSAQQDFYIEAAGNAGQVITANVTDIPFIPTVQNNLTWDGSGFTAPISGNYEVTGSTAWNGAGTGKYIYAFINGVVSKMLGGSNAASSFYPFSGKIYLAAGQRLSLRTDVTFTLSNASGPAYHTISITRLNGKNDSVCVGQVARNLIATIEYRGAATTLSTTPVAMPLNSIKGDSQIVSILSNQFTLQAGEYEIDSNIVISYQASNKTASSYLYNITNALEVGASRLSMSYGGGISVPDCYCPSRGITRISLLSSTIFELRSVCSSGSGITALGEGLASPNDLIGFIKITKLLGI
jgi:hypothetical protein